MLWFAFFDCPISFTWLLLTSLPCVFKFLSFPPSMSVHLFPHVSPACPALFPLLFPVQFCTWCHYLAPGNLCPCFFFFCLCFPSFTLYSQLFDFVFLFFPFVFTSSLFRLMDCFSTCLILGLNESVVSCGAEVLVLLDYLLAIDLKCPSDRELSMMEIND